MSVSFIGSILGVGVDLSQVSTRLLWSKTGEYVLINLQFIFTDWTFRFNLIFYLSYNVMYKVNEIYHTISVAHWCQLATKV